MQPETWRKRARSRPSRPPGLDRFAWMMRTRREAGRQSPRSTRSLASNRWRPNVVTSPGRPNKSNPMCDNTMIPSDCSFIRGRCKG
jgi:hypothetical protein